MTLATISILQQDIIVSSNLQPSIFGNIKPSIFGNNKSPIAQELQTLNIRLSKFKPLLDELQT
jgi:hypothetical protein